MAVGDIKGARRRQNMLMRKGHAPRKPPQKDGDSNKPIRKRK